MTNRGYCASCEVWTVEAACFLCGSRLLYGVPELVGGGKPHVSASSSTSAIVGAGVVNVEPTESLLD